MANTFKNYTSSGVGTSATTVYTVAASTTSVMIGCNIANVTSSQIKVDVQAAGTYIVKDAPIPAGSALSVLDGKIILETTDTVVVTSDTASSADVILSVLEQT
jgi:biopolymer transport protein ExbD